MYFIEILQHLQLKGNDFEMRRQMEKKCRNFCRPLDFQLPLVHQRVYSPEEKNDIKEGKRYD